MMQRQHVGLLAPAAMLSLFGLLFTAPAAPADEQKLDSESYLIPSADPGIQLYIRNKHPAGVTSFTPDKILLMSTAPPTRRKPRSTCRSAAAR
jgi:hypothetical protein